MQKNFVPGSVITRRLPGLILIMLISFFGSLFAHPMPTSMVLLTVHADKIEAEVQIPLNELQAAFGHAVNDSSYHLVARLGPELRNYLGQHIQVKSPDGKIWAVRVGSLSVHETKNLINDLYKELVAQIRLVPPTGTNIRHFTLNYDAVIHQVVTHKILVSVHQDWAQGIVGHDDAQSLGLIELDIQSNTIPALDVNLNEASAWKGFKAMVLLGTRHIAEGTDHLLFLLVLLLPAPLMAAGKRWGKFGGVRFSLVNLLRIVTAFTIGHSITLLAGSLGWVRLPSQPVEILIALSILISAIHAARPLFPGKEAWVAAGFGLIHGLAFAGALANLQLDAGSMALSILGFNIGIEIIQLLVIGVTIPWLILLSRTSAYNYVRIIGSILSGIAACAWLAERMTGQENFLTRNVELLAGYAPHMVFLLGLLALFFTLRINQSGINQKI